MTQREASFALRDYFYAWLPAPWDVRESISYFVRDSGELVRSHLVTQLELDKRLSELIGKDFKFEVPTTPTVGNGLLSAKRLDDFVYSVEYDHYHPKDVAIEDLVLFGLRRK